MIQKDLNGGNKFITNWTVLLIYFIVNINKV